MGPFEKEFAVSGEFASKHFNSGGDFLNSNGDFSLGSTNPPVIPMAALPLWPTVGLAPIPQRLERDVPGPLTGVDMNRHQSLVQLLVDLVEKCLTPNPAQRILPEAALEQHSFFLRHGR